MKIGAMAENLVEWIALRLGMVPIPLLDSAGVIKARVIMAAVKLGVFEAIGSEGLTAQEVSARCQTHPAPTEKLLNALTAAGYLHKAGEHYRLTALTRKWLLKDSAQSLHDYVRMQYLEWNWLAHCEDYISTGEPFIIHRHMTEDEWGVYQRSMRALAGLQAQEVARLTPVPAGARTMLDIGGSHGYNSVALCRRYPELSAVVLDLPEAVKHASPILEEEGMGERVILRAGNALTTDLGVDSWDLILMANLVQNFDEGDNRDLVRRAAQSLRPGGVLAIQESFQPRTPENAGQTAVLLDFFFSMTSPAQTWSQEEIASWQEEAGLLVRKAIYFRGSRDYGQQVAVKPGG